MKKLKILVFVVGALCSERITFAQVTDSCLYIQPDSMAQDWKHTNQDSVALDTCSSSSTYRYWYSKRYGVDFKVNAFHLGYGAPDSVMIVHWEDIDTVYGALRDSFESIYNKWVPFYFLKVNPEDTVGLMTFKIIFDGYLLAYGGVLDDLLKIMTDGLVEITFNEPLNPPLEVVNNERKQQLLWSLDRNRLIINLPQANGSQFVKVRIYDLLGRELDALTAERSTDNWYHVHLNNLSSGIYLCHVEQFHSSFLFVVQ